MHPATKLHRSNGSTNGFSALIINTTLISSVVPSSYVYAQRLTVDATGTVNAVGAGSTGDATGKWTL